MENFTDSRTNLLYCLVGLFCTQCLCTSCVHCILHVVTMREVTVVHCCHPVLSVIGQEVCWVSGKCHLDKPVWQHCQSKGSHWDDWSWNMGADWRRSGCCHLFHRNGRNIGWWVGVAMHMCLVCEWVWPCPHILYSRVAGRLNFRLFVSYMQ